MPSPQLSIVEQQMISHCIRYACRNLRAGIADDDLPRVCIGIQLKAHPQQQTWLPPAFSMKAMCPRDLSKIGN